MKIYSAPFEGITTFEGKERDIKHMMKTKKCAEYEETANEILQK